MGRTLLILDPSVDRLWWGHLDQTIPGVADADYLWARRALANVGVTQQDAVVGISHA